jgi:transcriptional regulator with XRE-family HTH domain
MNTPYPQSDFRSRLASMSPDELKHTMRYIGCASQQRLADRIGVSRSAVWSWCTGRVGVPRHIAMLLRLLAEAA